jgi:hypothetical protein
MGAPGVTGPLYLEIEDGVGGINPGGGNGQLDLRRGRFDFTCP